MSRAKYLGSVFGKFGTKGEFSSEFGSLVKFPIAKYTPKLGSHTPEIAYPDVQLQRIFGKVKFCSNIPKLLEHSPFVAKF